MAAGGHEVVTADGGQRGIDTFRDALARGQPVAAVMTDLGPAGLERGEFADRRGTFPTEGSSG